MNCIKLFQMDGPLSLIYFILTLAVLGGVSGNVLESQPNGNLRNETPFSPQASDWDFRRRNLGTPQQNHFSGKQEKRQKKQDRRKQRQERREERRKQRYRSDDLGAGSVSTPYPPLATEYGPGLAIAADSHFRHPESHASRHSAPPHNQPKFIADMVWLKNNITSIWFTLQHIQKDMKQIRRQLRADNQNRASAALPATETSTEEPCDPYWETQHNTCADSEGLVCGKVGKCHCGQCVCKAPFYGVHCQCNDMICFRDGGVMCGGAGRGQCRCGKCVCRAGFTGSACECSTSTADCQRENDQICSGAGSCVCNRCQCNDGYYGKYCDESIYSAGVCERLKPCVLCAAYGKKIPQCEDCDIRVVIVDQLGSSSATCLMINLGCILKYSYQMPKPASENQRMTVLVQKQKDTTCLSGTS